MLLSVLTLSSLILSPSAQAACPTGTVAKGELAGKTVCAFAQKKILGSELTLTAENFYLLEQGTYIGGDNRDSSILRIQPGTKILANAGAFLSVMRGSQIFAEGTKENPVVFTAAKQENRKRGEWGGLVINGNAPINACNGSAPVCEAVSEGIKEETVKFGGNNAQDNSGVLRFVRVEFAGYPIAQDNELNGITFNGVGAGTEVDYVQVHRNADDGVEFFGGTVNVKHLVLTDNDDDALDWDMGWNGKAQFVLIDHADDIGDNGFESSNLKSPKNASPRANPEISNVTLLGGVKTGFGLLLKDGTGGRMSNMIVSGFTKGCVDIDDLDTFNAGALSLTHTILSCTKTFEEENGDPWSVATWVRSQEGNQETDPLLNGWLPKAGSPAFGKGVTPQDFFFEEVDFVGAFGSEDWSQGWINTSAN